jgi:predicted DNA-binding protein YlxM (UPF0122 family)
VNAPEFQNCYICLIEHCGEFTSEEIAELEGVSKQAIFEFEQSIYRKFRSKWKAMFGFDHPTHRSKLP